MKKVLARTQVSSLNVHGLHGEIPRDGTFFYLDNENDTFFTSLSEYFKKVLFRIFNRNVKIFGIRSFNWTFDLGEEDSIYQPVILEIFWSECFCEAVVFFSLIFYLSECLLPKSPFESGKLRKTRSRLLSCGTELKEEMELSDLLQLVLAQERWQGIWGRSSPSNRKYAFM